MRCGLVDGAGLDIGCMQRCAVFQGQRHAIGLNGFEVFAARNESDVVARQGQLHTEVTPNGACAHDGNVQTHADSFMVLVRVPMPSMATSTTASFCQGMAPSDVPQEIISPASRVMPLESLATNSCGEKNMSLTA